MVEYHPHTHTKEITLKIYIVGGNNEKENEKNICLKYVRTFCGQLLSVP